MSQGSILILGNASQVGSALRNLLVERGFSITGARDAESAIHLIHSQRFDLLVLDLDMPGRTGNRICQEIRGFSNIGIIVLAESNTEKEKVESLLAGADDYLTKPVSTSELLARVRGVIRRSSVLLPFECSSISLDGVEVDFDRRRVRTGKREQRLTPKEFDLLRYLATRANQTITHRDLLKAVWGVDYGGTDHCLRYYIGKLRKKIEASPDQPKYLLTVPWVGYHLRLPE